MRYLVLKTTYANSCKRKKMPLYEKLSYYDETMCRDNDIISLINELPSRCNDYVSIP